MSGHCYSSNRGRRIELYPDLSRQSAISHVLSDTLDLPNASWFIPDAWVGPPIIGWSGCLEAFRFAFDPTEDNEYLYFDAYPNDVADQ